MLSPGRIIRFNQLKFAKDIARDVAGQEREKEEDKNLPRPSSAHAPG